MRRKIALVALAMVAGAGVAAGQTRPAGQTSPARAGRQAKPNALTPEQIAGGWILVFDGQTPFGWKIEGDGKVADGAMVLGGGKATTAQTTTEFSSFVLSLQYSGENLKGAEVVLNGQGYELKSGPHTHTWMQAQWTVESAADSHTLAAVFGVAGGQFVDKMMPTKKEGPSRTTIGLRVPADAKVSFRDIKLKPLGAKPIFNGKDLAGWKPVPDHPAKFTVTDQGEINVKNGGGDLQSEWQGDDFVLQLEVLSNGKSLNSGIFFRALPGQYWQGYEAQIRNQWEGDDRTKPVDYGTGGIYNRQPTRKVVSSDHEWFTMTVAAGGPHLATWVNGYQCTDYVDTQKDARNARKGRYLGKGCISIQGHDRTTDLNFRNLRVSDLPKKPEPK
ncbi:MAG: DUF1080 domain-containing protein [Planctomycetes bacterium]|nr:DUF1080 domain-containing protein [Planctomycetota bacterium]